MFSFGNPKILFLLLLIPAMFGLFLLARKARTKKLKRYGRLDVVLGQIPDASRYTPWPDHHIGTLRIQSMLQPDGKQLRSRKAIGQYL